MADQTITGNLVVTGSATIQGDHEIQGQLTHSGTRAQLQGLEQGPNPVNKTANYGVPASESGHNYNNNGTGSINYTLPSAVVGLRYVFTDIKGVGFVVTPQSGDRFNDGLNGTQYATGHALTFTPSWAVLEITCYVAGHWHVTNARGSFS